MNRLLPGIALAFCWLLLLLKGSIALFAMVLLVGLSIGAYEYAKMALFSECLLQPFFFAILVLLPLLSVFFVPQLGIGGGIFCAFLLFAFWTLATYREGFDSYAFFCRCGLGLLWVGFLGTHLMLLRELPQGNAWLLILTGITAGSDSGAYYCGRAFGRHKLSPLISPNKTVEGAMGGVVTGIIVAAILATLLLPVVPWGFLVVVAFVLTVVGICGDLVESVIKRATGTKDSGAILGGHGGILDRADSILFAAPIIYYSLLLLPG